ncbi:MAG: putative phospholipid ABC transporter permease protein MlaE [Candidatus Methanoperedenaceae archaeon GB37]|nr:MAG: putative phospholipid ABC transporter permease protein MlaE [Candidatus Methanoperedenaceae archaeon GB37]CAD7780253.1 putative phospholipid ABC transporter permease protein MlaE [Candidatus Methanoperedenaceae archaeon GB37]
MYKNLISFIFHNLKAIFERPFFFSQLWRQIYIIGADALPLISTAALAVGFVLALQTGVTLQRFGAQKYLAAIVGLSMVRELGPVLTALLVASRSGSGITAEIGAMKVTQQIDALRVSAIPPLNYLVVPKLLACIVCLPLLTVIADVVGVIGGGILAVVMEMSTAGWYAKITAQFIEFADFFPGLIKASFFGFLIASISAYFGFNTQRGTQSVGKATTTAVVTSSLAILISDVILTRILLIFFS